MHRKTNLKPLSQLRLFYQNQAWNLKKKFFFNSEKAISFYVHGCMTN